MDKNQELIIIEQFLILFKSIYSVRIFDILHSEIKAKENTHSPHSRISLSVEQLKTVLTMRNVPANSAHVQVRNQLFKTFFNFLIFC